MHIPQVCACTPMALRQPESGFKLHRRRGIVRNPEAAYSQTPMPTPCACLGDPSFSIDPPKAAHLEPRSVVRCRGSERGRALELHGSGVSARTPAPHTPVPLLPIYL